MNGRVYDYNLGRFLSVDPFIQDPGNSQSLNPYSYIMNNPFAGTDPSGYRSICKTDNHCDKVIYVNPNTLGDISVAWNSGAPSHLIFHNQDSLNVVDIASLGNKKHEKDVESLVDDVQQQHFYSTGATEVFVDKYGTTHYGGWGVNWHAYKKAWLETGELDPDVTALMNQESARMLPNFSAAYDSYVRANNSIGAAESVGNLKYLGIGFIGTRAIGSINNWVKSVVRNMNISKNTPLFGAKAYHHTASQFVDSIRQSGLRPGSYATPTKGLTPLQAKIELALPGNLPRNSLLQINLSGMRRAGYEIPDVTRVGNYAGMPGGGYEMKFPYAIPQEFIKVIRQQ